MKKLILGFIFFNLYACLVFGMEEKSNEKLDQKLNDVLNELDKILVNVYHNQEASKLPKIIKDMSGTPLIHEIAQLIIAGANPNFEPEFKTIAGIHKNLLLDYLISYGFVNLIQLLIAYGAKLDLTNDFGLTPLIAAVSKNKFMDSETQKNLINILIEQGADVNQETSFGSALLQTIRELNPEITEILLHHGAKLDKKAQEKLFRPFRLTPKQTERHERIISLLKAHGFLKE